MRNGRPLRFLAVTLGGWTVVRVTLSWPAIAPLPALIAAAAPEAAAQPGALPTMSPRAHKISSRTAPAVGTKRRQALSAFVASLDPPRQTSAPTLVQSVLSPDPDDRPPLAGVLAPIALTTISPSRLSGSGWFLLRGGAAASNAPFGGQLGGDQAGIRLTYALGARRVALAARVSTPLAGRGREAAIGVEWRPTALPVRVVAEQRIGLDGNRGGPSIGVIGGFGPSPVAAGFRLETYGQAGAIAHGGVEGFVDGAVRLARPVATPGGIALDLGIGAWGGAQRDAARLDIGPSLGATLPLGDRRLRVALDWRQRVAGTASPGSGPALSIGTDF